MKKPERPEVTYVVNRDMVHQFFERIVVALLPFDRFYRRNGRLFHLGIDRPERVTPKNIQGFIVANIEIRYTKRADVGGSEVQLGYGLLRSELALAFLHSAAIETFPEWEQRPAESRHIASEHFADGQDAAINVLSAVAQQYVNLAPATAAEWVERLEAAGHTSVFQDGGRERTARGKATRVGLLFRSCLGVPLGVEGVKLVRRFPRGTEGKPRYAFVMRAARAAKSEQEGRV